MNILVIQDGWFGENLPDGQYAVSKLRKVVTHLGEWPIPDEWLRFTRVFDTGTVFKAAGQSQDGAGDIILENGVRRVLGPSYGVNTVAFDLDGNPVQNIVPNGSQGLRWIDAAGIHTGDATYVHPTIPGLWEYTTHGDITVGQGDSGAHIICPEGRFILYPGYTVFIRFNRVGDKLAVAIVIPGACVLLWFNKSEITQFPRYEVPAVPAHTDVPQHNDVPEPPKLMPQAPNQLAVVQRVFAAHPEIDRVNEETRGRAVDYVIAALGGKPWGRKARNKDGTNLNTDGLTYLRSDGLYEIYDIIDGHTGEATWDGGEPVIQGQNGWWAPGTWQPVDSGGSPAPVPAPASVGSQLDASMKALSTQIELMKGAIAAQGAMIDTLRATVVASAPINGVKVALRTDSGQYLCAEGGGGGEVNASRSQVGGWETFTLEQH